MFNYVTISTKEKRALKKFLFFFSKINFFSLKLVSQKNKKIKRKFITVLKSPHVNKTAQEQFEFKIFESQIIMYSDKKSFFYAMLLKKTLQKGFSGLKIKLTYNFDKTKQNKKLLSFLNPDNILLKNSKTFLQIKTYFFLFDSYGEMCVKALKNLHF